MLPHVLFFNAEFQKTTTLLTHTNKCGSYGRKSVLKKNSVFILFFYCLLVYTLALHIIKSSFFQHLYALQFSNKLKLFQDEFFFQIRFYIYTFPMGLKNRGGGFGEKLLYWTLSTDNMSYHHTLSFYCRVMVTVKPNFS